MRAEVQGLNQLKALGEQARKAEKSVQRTINKRIREVVKPAGEAAKENARTILPKRGGLNHIVDKATVSAQTKTSGKTTGVTVTMRQAKSKGGRQRDLKHLDEGRLRKPVFARAGRKRTWRDQNVRPGFFTTAMQQQEDRTRQALVKVLDDVIKQLK